MISFSHIGNFNKTVDFLKFFMRPDIKNILQHYGEIGVAELRQSTPIDSGITSDSWGYEIHASNGRYEIVWTNDNVVDGVPVVILLQYGHGTRNGGYVSGIDFINPALSGVFYRMADELWKEVDR